MVGRKQCYHCRYHSWPYLSAAAKADDGMSYNAHNPSSNSKLNEKAFFRSIVGKFRLEYIIYSYGTACPHAVKNGEVSRERGKQREAAIVAGVQALLLLRFSVI